MKLPFTRKAIDPDGGQYTPANQSYDSGYSDGFKAGKEYMKAKLEAVKKERDAYMRDFGEEQLKKQGLAQRLSNAEQMYYRDMEQKNIQIDALRKGTI